jgi:rubrerythrin
LPAQVLSIAYQSIFRTGIFADDCKIWKRQPAAYKTWAQFKIDFRVAYKEYNESLDIAPRAAGFHTEDYVDPQDSTIDAIANLATATAEDRKAVANLTETNASITKALAKSNEKLLTALAQVNTLTAKLADLRSGSATPGSTAIERKHYCWTCGYRSEHSSWNCPTPVTGHQKRVKAADIMNGSIVNKPT